VWHIDYHIGLLYDLFLINRKLRLNTRPKMLVYDNSIKAEDRDVKVTYIFQKHQAWVGLPTNHLSH
jgi:hypothetical protein